MLTTIAHGRVYNFSHAVGRVGFAPPAMNFPISVAVTKDGTAYILSRSQYTVFNPYISIVKLGNTAWEEEYLDTFGGPGEGDGQFLWPAYLVLDKDNNVYVSDEALQRISIFDKDGEFIGKWGTPGSQAGEFNGPSGLAFDAEENLWVVDSLNHRVQTYTKDGKFLNQWGTHGSGQGELNMPWGITIDEKGDVFVADWKNHRVQKFTASGTFLAQFGWPAPKAGALGHPKYDSWPHDETFAHLRRPGEGNGEVNHPADVTVDNDGDVYILDWGNERIQIYSPDGEFITSLVGDARWLTKSAHQQIYANPDIAKARQRADRPERDWSFHLPSGIIFDGERNRLVIADTHRRRLQIYNKEKSYQEPQLTL